VDGRSPDLVTGFWSTRAKVGQDPEAFMRANDEQALEFIGAIWDNIHDTAYDRL
jgi:hypothetical protein